LGFWTVFVVVLLLAAYAGVVEYTQPDVEGASLRIDTFVQLTEQGRIKTAKILDVDATVTGTYVDDGGREALYTAAYPKVFGGETALNLLVQNRVPTTVDQQNKKRLAQLATPLLPALILSALLIYAIISYRRGSGLFAMRSGARKMGADDSTARFSDVAAQDAAVTELKEIRDFLADPGRFAEVGAIVPKGVLLYGPPGCGKTLLARAVAGEAGAAFYSISGSDFVEVYVGVGAARVRDLFREARENAPAIIFIDELDSVGRRRGAGSAGGGGRDEQEQALNQILAEMDGFSALQGIIVMGATNRPDILDPALLRPGRFDRTIGLERPDEQGRLAILAVHARQKPLDAGVDLAQIAKRAIGLSGADLAGVMNEAALLAARAGAPATSQHHLETALQRILEAPETQRRLSMRERSFGRSTGGQERVTFADVAGIEEALEELGEVKEYLAEPERFIDVGARPPRGFLLIGPPGCGKTLLARAVAGEANAAFFSVAATELVEIFSGEGAGRVRDLFAEAKTAAPSVVFLDELDAVGSRRGASVDGNREREQTLNQILIELDGFQPRSGVTVMAATNRPEILDEALVRPGRFDRTVTLGLPDRAGRRSILDVHARGKRLQPSLDLDTVAALTQGYSGADLANVMNEAALLTARHRLTEIPMSMVEEGIERIGAGIGRAQDLAGDDRTMVAYHEVGHALVGRALPGAQAPRKISIVGRGRSLGAAWNQAQEERVVFPRSALVDRMAGLLGGRVAEQLVFGEPGSGAADDLQRVTDIARWMVCELGMSDTLGPLTYSDGPAGGGRRHSEEAARVIDSEVRRLVTEASERAQRVLTASRTSLNKVAEVLMDRETLSAAEIDALIAPPDELANLRSPELRRG